MSNWLLANTCEADGTLRECEVKMHCFPLSWLLYRPQPRTQITAGKSGAVTDRCQHAMLKLVLRRRTRQGHERCFSFAHAGHACHVT